MSVALAMIAVSHHEVPPRLPAKTLGELRCGASVGRRLRPLVQRYNDEHLHSAIRYVTPSDRHARKDRPLLAKRHDVYTKARRRTPRRWTGETRNWSPVGAVYLNPIKQEVRVSPIASPVR